MNTHTGAEVMWAPSRAQIEASRLWALRERIRVSRGIELDDYSAVWEWSVTDPNAFWDSLREYFGMVGDGLHEPALAEERMPGAVWYPDARVNYAENVLRHAVERPADVAVVEVGEDLSLMPWTWAELESRVAAFAARLRERGVQPGDRVAGVLPNIPEAIVALLATVGLGAVWTISSPDLAPVATLARLTPLDPVVIVGTSGYSFKGSRFDTRGALAEIAGALPSVRAVLVVDAQGGEDLGGIAHAERVDLTDAPAARPQFHRVPFDHPLWVLFSSGTSGPPKGIVHGHGGIMLEAWKAMGLQFGLGPGDRYFTAANTNWMVWNTLGNTLLSGAAVITYAGAPTWPRVDRQFEVVAAAETTMFSTGAAYLGLVERSGLRPGDDHDLSRLHTLMSTGSVLAPSTWRWVHESVKNDLHLSSDSGGTDICSGFVGGNPWQPERLGELQGATLGTALEIRGDDGGPVADGDVGELTIVRPMPSMPVRFWNDPDGERYRSAYFESDPDVWTHGDWISRTPSGGYIVHGRSDATLNRDGVRIGSADIYAALILVPEVRNSVVLGIELPGGRYWMPLFVELAPGVALEDDLRERISAQIRSRASARHVPDDIEAVPAVPMTHAGKRIEVPLKKLFLGHPVERALNRDSLANPEAADWFVARSRRFLEEHGLADAERTAPITPSQPRSRHDHQ